MRWVQGSKINPSAWSVGTTDHAKFSRLPLPNEIHALVDPRIKAVVDWATESGGFQEFSLRMIRRKGHSHFGLQPHNPPGRIRAHFLHRLHRHSLQLDAMPFCHDSHDRGHAGGERGGHKVGWRKAFPLPFVIHGSIGGQLGSGRAMNSLTVKLPLVTNGDFDGQGRISFGLRPGSGPKRRLRPAGT